MQVIKGTRKKKPLYSIDTEDYEFMKCKGRVAIFDTETDPFAHNRVVKPFTCGFYIPDSDEYFDFWGDDCIKQFFDFLEANFPEEMFTIFTHNGGNFDFYFITDFFDEGMKPFIINGRLVRVFARGHEFRDSYTMIPVALGNALKAEDGGKIEIDYAKFEREVREEHKAEILHYQRQDCIALGTMVLGWLKLYGNRLTIASAGLSKLRSFHGIECMDEKTDDSLRPYYFGGRCQAFRTGIIKGSFKGYDINSSYPKSMRDYDHPVSCVPIWDKTINERTHFAKIRAWSNGALPMRAANGGLDFPIGVFDFFACIHEITAGLDTGTLRILKVYETVSFSHMARFDYFVDTFYDMRIRCGIEGDEVGKSLYKFGLNAPYGKLAQDSRRYENFVFDPKHVPMPHYCAPCHERIVNKAQPVECENCASQMFSPWGWRIHTEHKGKLIYARPQKPRGNSGFFNVAAAASITSASRASLLRAIAGSTNPLYCDTDSLICEDLDETAVEIDKSKLGAWKLEFEADEVCIGGKKLYVVYKDGEEVKKASKGVRLEGHEIRSVCEGEMIEYSNPIPKFKLNGDIAFVTRRIRKTGQGVLETDQERLFKL